jgi:4-hydroxy-tetrahydrodipicolinate reductase
MVNVCFAGITGWAASAIAAAIDQADDLTLCSGVSRSAAGESLATVTGSRSHGSIYATVSEALEPAEADVSQRRLRSVNEVLRLHDPIRTRYC